MSYFHGSDLMEQEEPEPTLATAGAGKQRKGFHIGAGSARHILKKLEKQLHQRQARAQEAESLNAVLRAKEKVLLENVASQGDILYFVALAAFQQPASAGEAATSTSVTQSLLQDVKVLELLELVSSSTAASQQEPYTTRCMRTAFTPERLQLVRSYSVQQVVQQLQQLTMKLAMLLQLETSTSAAPQQADVGGPAAGNSSSGSGSSGCLPLLSYSLDGVVDDYTELAMLLHVAADRENLKLGMLNLDTMQPQEPPAGHWKYVLNQLQLQPDQVAHLCAGFQAYEQKTTPLVASTHELARRIHLIACSLPDTDTHHHVSGASSPLPSSCTSSAVTALHRGSSSSSPQSPAAAGLEDLLGSGSSFTSSSGGGSSRAKPWQQFGLATGGLLAEESEELEQLLAALLHKIMQLRELHRTLTFLWLNTLDKRQKAVSIVKSYPFWSQPLAMCKHLVEEQQSTHRQQQQQGGQGFEPC